MAWVRSEYAGEFAVLSAWLSMVLPWNVVYHQSVPNRILESKMAIIRFSIIELQFRFPAKLTGLPGGTRTADRALERMYPGYRLIQDIYIATPPGSAAHYQGNLQLASIAWTIGALTLLVSFVISLVYYRLDESFEARYDYDPVRLIGALLGVATLAMAAATVLYYLERDFAGIPIPVGVVVMGALSVALLRVERK